MPEIRLKIYRSATEFRTETYRQPRVTIGRDVNNEICIPDKDVSRFHSMFESAEEGWLIVDLESTNGTFLNGICIKKSQIKIGDVVVIGNTRLHVMECPSAAAAASPRAGNYRVVLSFDASGMVGAKGRQPARQADTASRIARRGDPTPMPGTPKALAPILTTDEILQGAKDPKSTAGLIASWLYPVVAADACVIYLCNPETQVLENAAVEPAGKYVSVPSDVLNYVRDHRIAVHAQVDKQSGGRGGPVQAVMCAPILNKRQLLGAIALVCGKTQWKLGDPDLEAVAVAGLAAGAALGCAHSYGQLERAYLDLLEATDALPASVGEALQGEAETALLESMVERLRANLARIEEQASPLAGDPAPGDPVQGAGKEILDAARESDRVIQQLQQQLRRRREVTGETWPVPLLLDTLPALRDVGGGAMEISDRIASELPAVAVGERVIVVALARIVAFCRDRMQARRLTLTAEMHGFETPLEVAGYDPIAAGHYVHVAIESQGDPTAFEDLQLLCDDVTEEPCDLRDRVLGLYWAARMLRRAAGRLIVRGEGDLGVGFDLYLPVLT